MYPVHSSAVSSRTSGEIEETSLSKSATVTPPEVKNFATLLLPSMDEDGKKAADGAEEYDLLSSIKKRIW